MNMWLFIYVLLIAFSTSTCRGEDTQVETYALTFADMQQGIAYWQEHGHLSPSLAAAIGNQVTIRGFIYTSSAGQKILAAEPNLKSCCISSASKAKAQIALLDMPEDTSSTHATTLVGTLQFAAHNDHPFALEGAAKLSSPQNFTLISGGFVVLALSVSYLIYVYFLQSPNDNPSRIQAEKT
jgi:hypothetical protein